VTSIWDNIKSVFGESPGDRGLIGSRLEIVQKSDDFFVFFNFAPVGEETLPDRTQVISLKPTGEAFKALVTLRVNTDAAGIIRKIELAIARDFIDDPKRCIYAADLAKSFLGKAIHTAAGEPVDSLAGEISAFTAMKSDLPMITRGPLPRISGPPSPAYLTYAGQPEAQTLLYKSGKFQLELVNEAGPEPVLKLTVSPRF
jgi:hypothetical protein